MLQLVDNLLTWKIKPTDGQYLKENLYFSKKFTVKYIEKANIYVRGFLQIFCLFFKATTTKKKISTPEHMLMQRKSCFRGVFSDIGPMTLFSW